MDSDSVSLRYQKIHLSQKDQLSQMKNQMMFQIFSRFDNSRGGWFWEFVYVDHTYVNMCLWFTNSEKWDENNPFIVTSLFKSCLYFERKSPMVPSEPFDTLELVDLADLADDFTAIFVALAIFLTSSNFCWLSISWACCCKIELTYSWLKDVWAPIQIFYATMMLVT